MAYLALDNHFPQHPKIAPLSDAAFRLHVSGLTYCSALLTDGLIPAGIVPTLMPKYRPAALQELIGAGIWLRSATPTGFYVIHDFLDWNPSRAQVEKRRTAAAIGARARWDRINGKGD